MSDRKFTPAEAAIAVLAKAKELFEASTLAKAEGAPAPLQHPPQSAPAPKAPEQNPGQHQEIPLKKKGSYKLAEFMGRREHKASMKNKEMDKMESQPAPMAPAAPMKKM
jgi:hypothetical protein